MDEMLRMAKVDEEHGLVAYNDLVDTVVGKPPRSRLVRARTGLGVSNRQVNRPK